MQLLISHSIFLCLNNPWIKWQDLTSQRGQKMTCNVLTCLYKSPVKARILLKEFCLSENTTQIGRKKSQTNWTIFCLDILKIIPVWLLLYFLQKHSSNIICPMGQLANEFKFIQVVIGTKGSTEHSVLNTGINCYLKRLWIFEVSALRWQIWHRTYKKLMPFWTDSWHSLDHLKRQLDSNI